MTLRSGPHWICTVCSSPLNARDGVFNRVLGQESRWSCLACLAQAKGHPLPELERRLRAHIARRASLSRELQEAEDAVAGRPRLERIEGRPFVETDPEQTLRYSRQLSLPQLGEQGQRRLSRSRVLVLGAGGLGSPAAMYLAAAGVGAIAIADDDRVELSNLQRQILHGTATLGELKVASARGRLTDLNPNVSIEPLALRLDESNAEELVADFDVVVDGSDSLSSRYALNRACVRHRKPWVHGAIQRFYGHATAFRAGGRPCYQCLFDESEETPAISCEEAGVLGAVAGVVGSIQALEAVKLLLGLPSALEGVLWTWDAWSMQAERMGYAASPGCRVCG